MEIILIMLTGTLIGAFLMATLLCGFLLGMHYQKKKAKENAVELNETNKKAIEEMIEWMNYGGTI